MTADNAIPNGVSVTTSERRLVRDSAEQLQREFDGTFNTETIERYIHDSQQQLTSQASISMWLPVLIERPTRGRLRALARLEQPGAAKPAVLFLCVHNAGRSKPWTDDVARTADVIVTMGCGDACPILAGKQYLDWDIPSPTGQTLDVLAEIRDNIRTRVEALMASPGVIA